LTSKTFGRRLEKNLNPAAAGKSNFTFFKNSALRNEIIFVFYTCSVPCGTPKGRMVLMRWTSQMVASVHGIRWASVA
jgi:hypothetical protein